MHTLTVSTRNCVWGAAGLLLLAFGISGPVAATEVVMFRGAPPAPEALADILFAKPSAKLGRTRSIVLGAQSRRQPSATADTPESFGFPVNFALNSAEVRPESRAYLDQVGKMLNLPHIADQRILIEGHTDASGSDAYNRQLSIRRAQAVQRYLIESHRIAPERLRILGKGESEPLSGLNPFASLNRRVQFRRAY